MQVDLQHTYYNNTIQQYLYVLAAIIIAYLVLQFIKRWVLRIIKKWTAKTDNHYDDVLLSGVEKFVIPYVYLLLNFGIIEQLTLPKRVDNALSIAMTVVTIFFAARLINHLIHFALQLFMQRRHEPPERIKQFNGILLVVKSIVWLLGVLFLLDNIGYDVTTVVAGLGIGGIAVALAAQNILSDLFSYFVIFLDKPFEIGDYIAMGNVGGTVEKIGIKTSHLRSADGQQLIVPNADLVKSTINNYKRLDKRRVVFKILVPFSTSTKQLALIPGIIKNIVTTQQKVTLDRSHLQSIGETSIVFETIYFVDSDDYNFFMDTHQQVCLSLLKAFEKEGISLALPLQQILLQGTGQ